MVFFAIQTTFFLSFVASSGGFSFASFVDVSFSFPAFFVFVFVFFSFVFFSFFCAISFSFLFVDVFA